MVARSNISQYEHAPEVSCGQLHAQHSLQTTRPTVVTRSHLTADISDSTGSVAVVDMDVPDARGVLGAKRRREIERERVTILFVGKRQCKRHMSLNREM